MFSHDGRDISAETMRELSRRWRRLWTVEPLISRFTVSESETVSFCLTTTVFPVLFSLTKRSPDVRSCPHDTTTIAMRLRMNNNETNMAPAPSPAFVPQHSPHRHHSRGRTTSSRGLGFPCFLFRLLVLAIYFPSASGTAAGML